MEKDFTKYEYVNVTILKSLADLCRESYEAFGWEVMENTRGKDECIHMRRSRNVRERNRLMAEQRKMEDALMAIEEYEQKKSLTPVMFAIMTGLIGAGWLIASVIAISYRHMILFTIFEIIGFIVCAMAMVVYNWESDRHKDDYAAEENALYDKIYEACEKADRILGNEGG